MKWDQLPINTTFDRARRREVYRRIAGIVRGERVGELLALDEVRQRVRLFEQSYVGVRPIPVAQIVGTAGRSQDFDENFLPRHPNVRRRWMAVERHFTEGVFPPIEVYKVGDSYFVIDGHHRVAVARQRGVENIDAEITELRARFEIPPGADIGALIHAEQHNLFLEQSGLQTSRPGASIEFTRSHGYAELLELIKVHAYDLSVERGEHVPLDEAAQSFYDDIYAPTVEAIRRNGLLDAFPESTEADLFLWICERRRSLFPECGDLDLEDVVAGTRDEQIGGKPRRARTKPG